MSEPNLSQERRCEYARTTNVIVGGIPITSCGADACIYRLYPAFGDMRRSGPNGSVCLAEGNVPRKLADLEKIAERK